MTRIKVQIKNGVYPTQYAITEVTDDAYQIIQRKVIESVTKNADLQLLLQSANMTLQKLMETSITDEIVLSAITESVNNIKQRK